MDPAIINQTQLIAALRDELGIRTSSTGIHQMIRDGMPQAPKAGKKPRFVFAHVRAWLLGQEAATTPVSQQVRDHLFRSSLKKLA